MNDEKESFSFFIAVRDCLSMSHDLYIHVFAFYLEDLMRNEQ
jgi:hypothetical protein